MNNPRYPFIIIIAFTVVGISLVIVVQSLPTLRNLIESPSNILFILSTILAISALASILFSYVIISNRLPIAHNVAIVGFPKSGKTTLITSLFGEIFARRVVDVQAKPTGKTIERINADLAKLEKGQALGPTTDQEIFAYRTNVKIGNWPFTRTYKVEFGDFPGEDSFDYFTKFGPWLHTTPFFKWVVDSDAVIFVVDLAEYLDVDGQKSFIAEISSAIRAAWQNMADTVEGGAKSMSRRPTVLVFTKADLFDEVGLRSNHNIFDSLKSRSEDPNEMLKDKILRLGFGDELPPIRELSAETLGAGKAEVERDFADLINFLRSESREFHILYTSCVGTVKGLRLGVADLLKFVLPI
jgi:GTPase SAR1 family protein